MSGGERPRQSRRAARGARAGGGATGDGGDGARAAAGSAVTLSRARYVAFLAITLLLPAMLLLAVEGGLRLLRPDGGLPLFVGAPGTDGRYLRANPLVARRYFAGESLPPRPSSELFAADRPERAFRVFVLGESAAAGFPYPANGSFSRLLRDVLRDALPGDSVEVVNLAIAATNSYTMQDLAAEVAAARPDLVLVYAGHNEYYGALGVGSAEGGGVARPALVRGYLRLLRLRTFLALRDGVARLASDGVGGAAGSDSVASLMELLARDQQIPFDGDRYHAGLTQFDGNVERLVRRLRAAGVPVFLASVASNERDLPPLAAPAN
ncbi:MAG: SGNH/GDSL hydrolase family protein, partial [Gemmatimonadaceae bacterium]